MSGLHLKRLHLDADSFIIWCGPKDNPYRPSLGIHVEHPWSNCVKEFDAPPRLYFHLFRWFVIIAMTKDAKSQSWNCREGNTERWRWITWHPDHRTLCCRALHTSTKFGKTGEWECARLKGHKGDHA